MKEILVVVLTHLAAIILGGMGMFVYLTKWFYGDKEIK